MSTNPAAAPAPKPVPHFPCPKCGANLLAEGFHNSCTETQRLREDNYPLVVQDMMYLEHDEDSFETVGHECDTEAYCTSCGALLPWALFEIRAELDGIMVSQADAAIAKLLSAIEGEAKTPDA